LSCVSKFGVENFSYVPYFSDDFSQKKRLISVAVFLTIQGRVPEGIFVDERRHYGVLLFSMIIYAC